MQTAFIFSIESIIFYFLKRNKVQLLGKFKLEKKTFFPSIFLLRQNIKAL